MSVVASMSPLVFNDIIIMNTYGIRKVSFSLKLDTQATVRVTFRSLFSRGRVMFCEIYAQLKASKILACAVQNPDKYPGRGADRCG